MTPRPTFRWLRDILAAAAAISHHLETDSIDNGLVYDAVRVRLIEIGEAVKNIEPEVRDYEPSIPWADIAGMRDNLSHRYFDTDHAIVSSTLEQDLDPLVSAVRRLLERVDETD